MALIDDVKSLVKTTTGATDQKIKEVETVRNKLHEAGFSTAKIDVKLAQVKMKQDQLKRLL